MKTYLMEIEGTETEVIPTINAYSYALRKEIETILEKSITDDEFFKFCDYLLENEVLRNAYEEFKEDYEEED